MENVVPIPEFVTPFRFIPLLIPGGILPRTHFAFRPLKHLYARPPQGPVDAAKPLTPRCLPRTVGPWTALMVSQVPVVKPGMKRGPMAGLLMSNRLLSITYGCWIIIPA